MLRSVSLIFAYESCPVAMSSKHLQSEGPTVTFAQRDQNFPSLYTLESMNTVSPLHNDTRYNDNIYNNYIMTI